MNSMSCRSRTFVVTLFIGVLTLSAKAQEMSLGVFEHSADVGQPKVAGSITYDAAKHEYTLAGAGLNMWTNHDEFQFVWKKIKGDFIVTARGEFLAEGGDQHKKFGWIARANLDADAPHVNAALHGNGDAYLLWRPAAGVITQGKLSPYKKADVVQLERKGSRWTMSIARFGEPFVTEEIADVELPEELYVGLFMCSHRADDLQKVAIRDVRITIPAKDDFVPYRDYIGSNLEILDVATGRREIVYHVADSFQAPNWTPDGKSLIYSHNGRLVRFDLATREATPIDTADRTRNNNDHVLSPDGNWIGLSNNNREDGNKSIVYVVPINGGTPRRITPNGHSYLHGWTPDGLELIFTGERNSVFDLYRIPLEGGEEKQITDGVAYNDGPEYSPDGKFIYFNSTRSGKMQLWRIAPDGTHYEQLTNDEFNNWFPHFSPDGKQVVFISFPSDITPKDHPFYKHVYLRMMPAEGGPPKVIAYLYGGQGTINVPSWSPDGKRLAFVSNTAGE